MKKFILISALFSLVFVGNSSNAFIMADYILVNKGEKELTLFNNGKIVKKYDISLGKAPEGPKRYEGDNKTPEGKYFISARNPKSQYFLSLKVSYPNKEDLARAQKLGKSAGGDIMIHGQWNNATFWEKKFNSWFSKDWTAGCIAVNDDEMSEIYAMVPVGTPIEIIP